MRQRAGGAAAQQQFVAAERAGPGWFACENPRQMALIELQFS